MCSHSTCYDPTRGLGRVALGLCTLCCGVVQSDSLLPHRLQHARLPRPSLSLCSSSCPLSQVVPSSHLVLCHPLSSCLQSFPASGSLLMNWLFASAIASFSFSISPSNEYPGLISFRMDWLDLLAVQGTLNSLLQHHSSKASVLRRSAFLMVQLSHPYVTTGKARASWCYIISGLLC